MTAARPRGTIRRPNMRRAVLLFPSGLTLGNLFFGVFAIITASRGDFRKAGIYVLLGGICDALDGRVARATNAGSQFGEELDSLVDAISFGLAPAMIMYFAVLNRDGWDWIFVFCFAACAVMRLARFNIEQAGTAKTYFQGLPSPAAGITLASYYWFSQSWLYNYGAIGDLPWQELLRFIMAALAFLMISNIPYPVFPRTGFRSLRAIGASLLVLGSIALLASKKLEYFFPFALIYVAWGVVRWVFFGLFERRQPTIPYDLSEGEDEEEEEEIVAAPPPRRSREVERITTSPRSHERVAKSERPPREARPDRPERPDRPDRADRPVRTDAERTARREKREKRDRARAERGERGGVASAVAPPETGPGAITLGAPAVIAKATTDEIIGRLPGDASGAEPIEQTPAGEGTPGRKRKRRRRRGERKNRDGTSAGDTGEGGTSESGESGASPSDVFDADDTPYSTAPQITPPPPPVQPPAVIVPPSTFSEPTE